jgi:hypothetical protein
LGLLLLTATLLLAACGPEATRTRGGGPGADPGNRVLGPSVEIHGQSNPAYQTPRFGKAIKAEEKAPPEPQRTPEASLAIEFARPMGGSIYPGAP